MHNEMAMVIVNGRRIKVTPAEKKAIDEGKRLLRWIDRFLRKDGDISLSGIRDEILLTLNQIPGRRGNV